MCIRRPSFASWFRVEPVSDMSGRLTAPGTSLPLPAVRADAGRFPGVSTRMRGMAHQAAILSVSRIANYGLMIISPIVLVRFLTVTDFGRYREFLLYASLLQTAAYFSLSESLLYFVPLHPASMWRVVRETMFLTAVISLFIVGVVVAFHFLIPEDWSDPIWCR